MNNYCWTPIDHGRCFSTVGEILPAWLPEESGQFRLKPGFPLGLVTADPRITGYDDPLLSFLGELVDPVDVSDVGWKPVSESDDVVAIIECVKRMRNSK